MAEMEPEEIKELPEDIQAELRMPFEEWVERMTS